MATGKGLIVLGWLEGVMENTGRNLICHLPCLEVGWWSLFCPKKEVRFLVSKQKKSQKCLWNETCGEVMPIRPIINCSTAFWNLLHLLHNSPSCSSRNMENFHLTTETPKRQETPVLRFGLEMVSQLAVWGWKPLLSTDRHSLPPGVPQRSRIRSAVFVVRIKLERYVFVGIWGS